MTSEGAEPADLQGDALLSIHVDDLGLTHGANDAFLLLSEKGRVDGGSVMVPCPWFPHLAEMAEKHPSLDIGVHLTLNAEKRHYRWRPLTRPGVSAGLVDADGFMHRTVASLVRHAHPEAVEAELRAQIDAALNAGIDVTHLDDHMGAILAPPFVEIYARLARDYALPIFFPRSLANFGPIHNLPGPFDVGQHHRLAVRLEQEGQKLADRILETPWHRTLPVAERYEGRFAAIGKGLTILALHPDKTGAIQEIEPDTADIRLDDFAYFSSAAGGRRLEEIRVQRITPRALRDRLRAILASNSKSSHGLTKNDHADRNKRA